MSAALHAVTEFSDLAHRQDHNWENCMTTWGTFVVRHASCQDSVQAQLPDAEFAKGSKAGILKPQLIISSQMLLIGGRSTHAPVPEPPAGVCCGNERL